MRALFVIDPIQKLKPNKDSSIDLMAVAQSRGHEVFVCEPSGVSVGSGGVHAHAQPVTLSDDARTYATFDAAAIDVGAPQSIDVATCGAVFIRPDPPFDDLYISLTLMLEPAEVSARFVNSPKGVRAVSEKLSALHFPEFIPPTLATYRADDAKAFAAQFDKVVMKPSYFGSGTGIEISAHADPEFGSKFSTILALPPRGPVIVQGFLPEVADGDVRMMMVDGHPVGTIGRKPAEGEFRANIAAGGSEMAIEPTPGQLAVAETVGAYLRENGILFGGLDFIGDKLIEINVTSPTLIQQLRRLGGPDISEMIWDRLESVD